MVMAAAVGATVIMTPAAGADDSGNVEAVYCLSDARRPEVVQAAAHLGKGRVVPGRPSMLASRDDPAKVMTLEQWRHAHPDDFSTVCSALIRANSEDAAGAGGGGGGATTSLLLLVAGAALTMLGTAVERAGQHQRQRLDALAAAIDDFRASAENYLEAWELDTSASHGSVVGDRQKLVAALRGLGARGRRRTAARGLAARIPLARPLADLVPDPAGGGLSTDFEARERTIREQRTLLNDALAIAESLARGEVAWRLQRAAQRLSGWRDAIRERLPRPRRSGGPTEGSGDDGASGRDGVSGGAERSDGGMSGGDAR